MKQKETEFIYLKIPCTKDEISWFDRVIADGAHTKSRWIKKAIFEKIARDSKQ